MRQGLRVLINNKLKEVKKIDKEKTTSKYDTYKSGLKIRPTTKLK